MLGSGLLEPTLQVGFFPKKSEKPVDSCSDVKCLVPEQLISAGTRLNFNEAYMDLDLIHGSYYGISPSSKLIEREASTVALEYRVDPKPNLFKAQFHLQSGLMIWSLNQDWTARFWITEMKSVRE